MRGAPDHGTVARYKSGCHCESCRDANTVYYREFRHRDRFRKWADSLTRDEANRILEGISSILTDGQFDARLILDYLESERRAAVNAKRRELHGGPKHGKTSTYSSYGCRCEICTTNYREWRRQRRAEQENDA